MKNNEEKKIVDANALATKHLTTSVNDTKIDVNVKENLLIVPRATMEKNYTEVNE